MIYVESTEAAKRLMVAALTAARAAAQEFATATGLDVSLPMDPATGMSRPIQIRFTLLDGAGGINAATETSTQGAQTDTSTSTTAPSVTVSETDGADHQNTEYEYEEYE